VTRAAIAGRRRGAPTSDHRRDLAGGAGSLAVKWVGRVRSPAPVQPAWLRAVPWDAAELVASRPPEMRDHGAVKDLEDLAPGEAQRAKRRDRKRVTRMVVDGGNLLRQVEALRARSERRRQGSSDRS